MLQFILKSLFFKKISWGKILEIIVNHRRCKVFFDNEKNVFTKCFYPKLENRLKYFFHLRKYPGENFKFIAEKLKTLGIKVPKITYVENYKVVTEKIEGVLLSEYLKENPNDEKTIKTFLDIIIKILKSGIYFGDFNMGNFIYSKGNIYAIDLEDYKKERFFNRGLNEAVRRLRKTLKNDEWCHYIEANI